jgi:hypothetical protein
MTVTQLPETSASYVESVNQRDSAAFMALFAEGAVVDDVGREFRGRDAIKAWSDREIFDAMVTLKVIKVDDCDGQSVITTEVDGNFDRTGLPDPLIMDHHITVQAGKVVSLACKLASNRS